MAKPKLLRCSGHGNCGSKHSCLPSWRDCWLRCLERAGEQGDKALAVPRFPRPGRGGRVLGACVPPGLAPMDTQSKPEARLGPTQFLTKNQSKPQEVWIPLTGCFGKELVTRDHLQGGYLLWVSGFIASSGLSWRGMWEREGRWIGGDIEPEACRKTEREAGTRTLAG